MEAQENPLHHDHLTVFDTAEVIGRIKASNGIKRFIERLIPHIDHSSYISPACNVWLAGGRGVKPVDGKVNEVSQFKLHRFSIVNYKTWPHISGLAPYLWLHKASRRSGCPVG